MDLSFDSTSEKSKRIRLMKISFFKSLPDVFCDTLGQELKAEKGIYNTAYISRKLN
jgi:hypothetical protein